MKVIDGSGAVIGRLASYAAQQALKGEEVKIVNSGEVIKTGKENEVMKQYLKKRNRRGITQKGPAYPTKPKHILKRTIRGMLPYKKSRGKQALKRIKCYEGIPKELKDEKIIKSGKGKQGISLKKISKRLRGE